MIKTLVCYIDGSYKPQYPNKVGSAIIMIKESGETEEIFFSKEDEELAKIRNVAGELRASMRAWQIAIEKRYDILELYYDYEGIEKWCTGQWKCKNKYTKMYKEFYDKISKELTINFHKVDAHSGDYYNELVDYLAKKSLEL